MKDTPFTTVCQGTGPDHPVDHQVNATGVPHSSEKDRGASHLSLQGNPKVMQKVSDPSHSWFTPPANVTKVPDLPELIARAVAPPSLNRGGGRAAAQQIADYLFALQESLPPHPYDLHVHRAASIAAPLRRLVDTGAVSTYLSERGWWVSTDEVSSMVPTGESLSDPTSAWCPDPNDWVNRDEVEFLIGEHRRHWPELFCISREKGGTTA